jgi:hypothetical protein
LSDLKLLPPLEWPEGATEERPRPPTRAPLDWVELAGRAPPERRWAVKGWLGFGHITLLVGSGGIGKTLLSQQMASCIALGRSFVGEVADPLTCLMWACEDDHDELWRRQVQIAAWAGVGLESFAERLVIVPRHGLENALVTAEFGRLMYSPLIAELKEQAHDLSADVVILDNVAQLFGAGENDRHAVTAFLNALSGALAGRAIMLLAHPSRSSGSEFSGSSAWENVARTRLYLGATLPGDKPDESEPQDNVRYLARRKANYSAKDWRRLVYANGALTPDEPEAAGGLIANIRAGKAERAVFAALAKLSSMGVVASDGRRSPQYLPKIMLEYKMDEGLNQRELTTAMRAMMVDGKIKRAEVGKYQNRTPLFGLVAA